MGAAAFGAEKEYAWCARAEACTNAAAAPCMSDNWGVLGPVSPPRRRLSASTFRWRLPAYFWWRLPNIRGHDRRGIQNGVVGYVLMAFNYTRRGIRCVFSMHPLVQSYTVCSGCTPPAIPLILTSPSFENSSTCFLPSLGPPPPRSLFPSYPSPHTHTYRHTYTP